MKGGGGGGGTGGRRLLLALFVIGVGPALRFSRNINQEILRLAERPRRMICISFLNDSIVRPSVRDCVLSRRGNVRAYTRVCATLRVG